MINKNLVAYVRGFIGTFAFREIRFISLTLRFVSEEERTHKRI